MVTVCVGLGLAGDTDKTRGNENGIFTSVIFLF